MTSLTWTHPPDWEVLCHRASGATTPTRALPGDDVPKVVSKVPECHRRNCRKRQVWKGYAAEGPVHTTCMVQAAPCIHARSTPRDVCSACVWLRWTDVCATWKGPRGRKGPGGDTAFHTLHKDDSSTLSAVLVASALCKLPRAHNKSCRGEPTYQEFAVFNPLCADWVVFCRFCRARLLFEKHGFSGCKVLVRSSVDEQPGLVCNPRCPARRGGHPCCGHGRGCLRPAVKRSRGFGGGSKGGAWCTRRRVLAA